MHAAKVSKNNRGHHDELAHRVDELREQAAIVGEGLSGIAATAGAVATDQLAPLQTYIKDKPLRSILIAAGVGAVLGLLLIRK